MPAITIRVGASVDRNLATALRPLMESAKRARAQVDSEMKGVGRSIASETKKGSKAADEAFAKLVAEVTGKGGKMMLPAVAAVKDFAGESKKSFDATKANFASLAKEAEKNFRAIERAKAAAVRDGGMGGFVRGVASAGKSNAREYGKGLATSAGDSLVSGLKGAPVAIAGAAVGGAKAFAESLGANFDLGSYIKQGVGLESSATTLSNNAYMPGKAGVAGTRVDPAELIKEVQSIGMQTGSDPTKAMDGLQKFVAKTGDLETGRKVLFDMAKLARATGSSLDDVADAAGDVSSHLADTPDKAKRVDTIMRAVAGGGKMGAIEMKDFAVQMAKVAASSESFEGNVDENMVTMAAIAQKARGKAGPASASEAANTARAFTANFTKGARLDAFDKFGVNTTGAGGKTRDPKQIIIDSLRAASSDKFGGMKDFNRNMGDMFKGEMARKAVGGFEQEFLNAGGGEAGIAAVVAAFKELETATMSTKEVNESFSRSMNTTEAKAQQFNAQMLAASLSLKTSLQPAVEKLAPVFLDLVGKVASGAEKLGAMMGLDDAALDKRTYGADAGAYTATSKLKADMKAPQNLTQEDVNAGDQAQTELDAAIKAREASLKEKKEKQKFSGSMNPLQMSLNVASFAVESATGVREARATQISAGEGELTRMKEQQNETKAVMEKVHAALTSGTMKVVVTNIGDVKGPELGGGQTPPPGEKR